MIEYSTTSKHALAILFLSFPLDKIWNIWSMEICSKRALTKKAKAGYTAVILW